MMPFAPWLPLLTAAFLGILILGIAKRVYFHPLSRFPGPKLWALSRAPYVLAMRSGTLAHKIKAQHETYGSVVRVGPNELSYTDPDACRDIYNRQPGRPAFPKDPIRNPVPEPGQTVSILDAPDTDHARLRKAWSLGFSERALKDQEPLIAHHVSQLAEVLKAKTSNGSTLVDLEKLYSFVTFDVICSLSFGASFDCLAKDQYDDWVAMLVYPLKALVMMASCRHFPWLYRLLLWTIPSSAKRQGGQHALKTREMVQRRLRADVDRPDFLAYVQKSRNELTDAEVEVNAAIMIIAGSHTLATALTGITSYLLSEPTVLQKLTEEIRSTFSDAAEIQLAAVEKLPYLSAVIQEGLRVVSPVPLGLTREVPQGGGVVCGKWLPEKTVVSYMQWAANLSAANFSKPTRFDPDRWLDPTQSPAAKEYAADRRDALQPFLQGPRDCIGRNLAYAEMQLILARVAFGFDLALPGGPEAWRKWEDQETYAVWVKSPLPALVTAV